MLNIIKIIIPILETNCYLVCKDKECIIFDCGGTDEILRYLKKNNLLLKKILLTHGHYDHISAIENIRKEYKDIEVIAFIDEKDVIEDENKNLSKTVFRDSLTIENIIYKNDNDIIHFSGIDIKLIATPGHTKGSCCYYIQNENILFSGDTLFFCSYGRYDFPTSSLKDIINSVGVKLMKFSDDVNVYPGHGIKTTIGYERKNNELAREYVINWGRKL